MEIVTPRDVFLFFLLKSALCASKYIVVTLCFRRRHTRFTHPWMTVMGSVSCRATYPNQTSFGRLTVRAEVRGYWPGWGRVCKQIYLVILVVDINQSRKAFHLECLDISYRLTASMFRSRTAWWEWPKTCIPCIWSWLPVWLNHIQFGHVRILLLTIRWLLFLLMSLRGFLLIVINNYADVQQEVMAGYEHALHASAAPYPLLHRQLGEHVHLVCKHGK